MSNIKTVHELISNGLAKKEQQKELESIAEKFAISITDEIQDNIKHNNLGHGIAKQFIPSIDELNISSNELSDPIGDTVFTKVKGVVHRHPDRCLLMPVQVCPVYCRFCFRRTKVGPGNAALSKDDLAAAYQYIKSHPEIWEVILTGGDPLILKPITLHEIMHQLAAIEHIGVIRIHTRVPVVDTKRITDNLIKALKIKKAVYVVLHANHPDELTPNATQAIANLVDAGIPMLSQSVLLKGINDDPKIMTELLKKLVSNRVKPYYLHHCDLAEGTSHFRTDIKAGQALMKEIRRAISGVCQPTYVLDLPGGYGKVPIGYNYIYPDNEEYCIEDHQGKYHKYREK